MGSVLKAVDGTKTYIMLVVIAATIFAQAKGFISPEHGALAVKLELLGVAATLRDALAKLIESFQAFVTLAEAERKIVPGNVVDDAADVNVDVSVSGGKGTVTR